MDINECCVLFYIITASRHRLFQTHGSSFKPVQPLCEIGNKSSSVHQLNTCVKMFRTKVKNHISTTEKLINRSLTGQRLGLEITRQNHRLATSVIICIDGIIGAGKSTLIRKLKKNFMCFEEPVEKWSLLPDLYSDMERFAIPFQFQVLLSQYDQYLSFKNINDMIIVERCPRTSKNVFVQMYIDNGLFDQASVLTYHKCFEQLSYEVDRFIYLDVEPQLALKRIKTRDRHGEDNITLAYLESLHERYEKQLNQIRNVYYVNANSDIETIELKVRNILENIFIKAARYM